MKNTIISNQDILKTIELIRDSFIGADKVYTCGSCVRFAMILKHICPKGEILYDLNHAIFCYEGECYDINGYAKKSDRHIPLLEYGEIIVDEALKLKADITKM